jgi:hypothetical protein
MCQPSPATRGWREPARDVGEPADPAGLAELWATVSASHGVLARRRSYFLTTALDDRLGEQLALVAMLQDWVPLAAAEVDELGWLLRRYVRATEEAALAEAAARVVHQVRAMAAARGRAGTEGNPRPE